MTGGVVGANAGVAIPGPKKTTITTTRVRDDITTELTNLDTKSDAWGKIIPIGFGRHRVAGALIWSSKFYKTVETFDDETTTKSEITWQSIPLRVQSLNPTVVNTPADIQSYTQDIPGGTQVTHGTETNSYIDLCYSVGKEGDVRKKRFIEKIRINDLIVYDASLSPPYVADGIGFSIRYGYDDAPPALMAKYPNGKFSYKGQTLVVFDKFPLAQFGDNIPQSMDVEWGCCVGNADDPDNGDIHDSGWRLRFWLSEWGTQNLETPFKLQIAPDTTQPGGTPSYGLPGAWLLGPDVLVYGTAIVTGSDPRFAADVNAVKIFDGIVTTVGGAANGSIWRFYRIMSGAAFIEYQNSGGIPFFEGNDYVRNDDNANAHGENYYEQNTVAYLFNAISSGKPNIYIKDRLISVTFDVKNTVSLSSFKGKGRSLYTTQLFRTKRGALPFGVKLNNADGVNLPSFWNGGFSNNRAGGSRNEWLGRGDGDPYYVGPPGEVFTYTVPQGDPPLAATVNSYVHLRNVYASE